MVHYRMVELDIEDSFHRRIIFLMGKYRTISKRYRSKRVAKLAGTKYSLKVDIMKYYRIELMAKRFEFSQFNIK